MVSRRYFLHYRVIREAITVTVTSGTASVFQLPDFERAVLGPRFRRNTMPVSAAWMENRMNVWRGVRGEREHSSGASSQGRAREFARRVA